MPVEQRPHPTRRRDASDHQSSVKPAAAGSASRLAWWLALLGVLTFEMSAGDCERTVGHVFVIVASEAFTVGLFSAVIWRMRRHDGSHESRLATIVCLVIAAFSAELFARSAMNAVLPLEQLLLALIRNAVLALLVFAHRPDCQRAACSLSLFLIIFASALSSHPWLQGLLALFAIVGIFWLSGHHGEAWQGRVVISAAGRPTKTYWVAGLFLPLGLLFVAPVAAISTRALPGFMPSSGGKDWYLENAQGGVGDGDALVAGTENIQSFAPIEDAPFLTSHEPSLYDMFDDSYNEPVKIEKQDRAISIKNEFSSQPSERELAESQSVGKEFSTVRKSGRPSTRQAGDRRDPALFFVKGRVPLHLKLETFDRFDGRDWTAEELTHAGPPLQMEQLNERPWLRVPRADEGALFSRPETHALKIIRLNSNRIPAPSQLLGVHIDKLDQAEFYRWAQPDILQMDREQLPSLTVIHVQSRVADLRNPETVTLNPSYGPNRYREVVAGESSQQIQRLAHEWTNAVPVGWLQVHAVIEHLRHDYVHDHDARPPADCSNAAADFLFVSQRGPDYQFATAAVLLLRSLGYSTRLVSGFYVDPHRFDQRAQHSPVLREDVHVWAEISTSSGSWISIEPTPGYELLQPMPTFWERLISIGCVTWRAMVAQAIWILIAAVTISVLLFHRKTLVDRMETLIWSWRQSCTPRTLILRTLRLVERRARRWGATRPASMSLSSWLGRLPTNDDSVEKQALHHFKHLADWALFSPEQSMFDDCDCTTVCRQTVKILSRMRITKLGVRASTIMGGPLRPEGDNVKIESSLVGEM